jgi:pyruvate ferredoxin oxidoreductase beta subunit
MNTGIQRSGATPFGAVTSTSPDGDLQQGKSQGRKNLTAIVAAHNIPYVAQASPHNWRDLASKVEKALSSDGPSFLNVIAPCHRGWRFKMEESIEMARLAVETCFWPLFEIEEGICKLTYKPKEKKPVLEWIDKQGRFAHLLNPKNQSILEKIQAQVDKDWEKLLNQCDCE